jgi:hypothetical protein
MRSPNYPQLSLPEAIEKTQILYRTLHTAEAPAEKIVEKLGYSSLNGRSMGVLSALKKYGLIGGKGDKLGVTRDAVVIIERAGDHPSKREALKRAALSPPLFEEIYDNFRGQMPDLVDLRVYLTERKFSRAAIDEISENYYQTMALVPPEEKEYTPAAPSTINEEESDMRPQQEPPATSTQLRAAAAIEAAAAKREAYEQSVAYLQKAKEYRFPLSFQRDVNAVVTIYGDNLKRRDLEILKKKVGDLIDAWEDEEEETAPEAQ